MSLRDFDINSLIADETPLARSIRAQLHLSSEWRVTGMKVVSEEKEYSDTHADERKAVSTEELKHRCLGKTYYYVSRTVQGTYRCPNCHRPAKPICYVVREINHVPDKGHQCILLVNIPKLCCTTCHGTPQVVFPAADRRKSYTRRLKEVVLAALQTRSKSSVAEEYCLHWSTVNRILNDAIAEAIIEQDLSHVTGVYVDETQFGHGQDYISVFLDQRHKVIFACRGHTSDVLDLFLDHLVVQGGDPERIRFFSADMSSAYESGITRCFPNAELVWDRFHLAKAVNDAINSIRKSLLCRKEGESLKLVKYTVLSRESNLTPKQAERLRRIRLNNPILAQAYDMKEVFLEIICLRDRLAMERLLNTWIEWVEIEGHPILRNKAKRFGEKLQRITAWTVHPISNSVCEGVNKNIQDIRRQACGYTDAASFFNMIFLRQGNLTFRI